MNLYPAAISNTMLCSAVLIGAVMGSFYACAVYRFIAGQTLTNPPRSMCPDCGYQIKWYENIPILSYIFLRGKCSSCNVTISPMYPVIECTSIAWAVLLMTVYGPSPLWMMYMFFGGLMIVASFIDLKTFILPDIITIPGSILAIPCSAMFTNIGWEGAILGAGIGGGLFWSLRLLYRGLRGVEGLGLGDVKIMFMIGALAGPQNLPLVITVSAFTGLCSGLVMMMVDRKREYGNIIPFGPFLAFGSMLSILYAKPFWIWYFQG